MNKNVVLRETRSEFIDFFEDFLNDLHTETDMFSPFLSDVSVPLEELPSDRCDLFNLMSDSQNYHVGGEGY